MSSGAGPERTPPAPCPDKHEYLLYVVIMVYLPFSSVYTREGDIYAVMLPRDAQQVLENEDFRDVDSKVGELTLTLDDREYPDAAKQYGMKTTAYLCPHQGVAKGWPPCKVRKEPAEVTDALKETARYLGKHIASPYAKCLGLAPPCKIE